MSTRTRMQKNRYFAKYCTEGDIDSVRRLLYDDDINVNWSFNIALKEAIRNNHIEIVNLLLHHPNIDTKYEDSNNRRFTTKVSYTKGYINMIVNPFSEAILRHYYDIMDLLINVGKVNIYMIEYLDMLIQMKNTEMNEYFLKQPGFSKYVLEQDIKYVDIISQDAVDIFLF